MNNDYVQVYATKGYRKEVELINFLSDKSMLNIAVVCQNCVISFN